MCRGWWWVGLWGVLGRWCRVLLLLVRVVVRLMGGVLGVVRGSAGRVGRSMAGTRMRRWTWAVLAVWSLVLLIFWLGVPTLGRMRVGVRRRGSRRRTCVR